MPGACTYFCRNGSSVVDYAMSSDTILDEIVYFSVDPPTNWSDHCPIRLKINTSYRIQNQVILKPLPKMYKWDNSSSEKLKNIVHSASFQREVAAFNKKRFPIDQRGTNAMGNELVNLLTTAGDKCLKIRKPQVPRKLNKNNRTGNSDVDKYYTSLKRELHTLGKNLLKYPRDPFLKGKFYCLKNNINKLIKKARQEQRNLILNKIHCLEEKKPDSFWKLVSEIRNKQSTGDPIDAETLLHHFRDLHSVKPTKHFDYKFEKAIEKKLHTINKAAWVELLDKSISEKDILDACKSLKNKKASGPDGINNEMLKVCVSLMLPTFIKALNHILHAESFPVSWSAGYIVALFKSGDYLNPGNYRGLTITSCLGKLFTKILNNRLIIFLEKNQIIAANQIAFKPNQRTTDHMLVLKTICDMYKSRQKAVYLCFVDLTKAFDTINRTFMLYKLYKSGLSTKFVNLIQSMYSDLKACIKTKFGCTETFPIDIGTRQGCNLSPSLFNLFINDLPNLLTASNSGYVTLDERRITCLMYADDIVLLSETASGLNKSIRVLENFCNT